MRYCVIHYCVVQSPYPYITLTLQTNRRLHTLLTTRQKLSKTKTILNIIFSENHRNIIEAMHLNGESMIGIISSLSKRARNISIAKTCKNHFSKLTLLRGAIDLGAPHEWEAKTSWRGCPRPKKGASESGGHEASPKQVGPTPFFSSFFFFFGGWLTSKSKSRKGEQKNELVQERC